MKIIYNAQDDKDEVMKKNDSIVDKNEVKLQILKEKEKKVEEKDMTELMKLDRDLEELITFSLIE